MERPPDWLAARWVGVDGPLVVTFTFAPDHTLRATFSRPDAVVLAADLPAKFCPCLPDARASGNARERLDRIEVELETPGIGPTYCLMIGAPAREPERYGGFGWGPVGPEHQPDEVQLFGERGASYYEAVLGYWDDAIEAERERLDWAERPITFARDRAR